MPGLIALVEQFVTMVEAGQGLPAMERFYAEDVVVFENREMARAGKRRCIEFEREQLSRVARPPQAKALKHACNERAQVSFVEWLIRFETESGRPMRIEEVAVQTWREGLIAEERFYYEGLVDEGD